MSGIRKLKKYTPTKFKAKDSVYNKAAADYAVKFIECLCHTKGTWAGKPFELIDWQERIIRDIFGILKPNGYRQFNTAYIEIPKKQGKSELAAAVALLLTCGDGEERAEVYGCAADRQQASIVFEVAADMVRMCPALNRRVKILTASKRIIYTPTNSFYQVLSAEAYSKHGFNIHGVVFDELHTQPNRKLFDVMTKGSGDARMQPLYFLITTAGTDTHSICYETHQKAKDILEGRKIDPTFYPVIYGAEEEDDWTSPAVWKKANPSLGITVGLDKVKERLIEALAVRKLSKAGRSPILCLVGPPGIGKTSIAKSIARAMNKKYVRLSFGGVRDEAEIRGHRKTYIGSMPGRIVTGIKTAGSMNPVFLMDEIDKMASDYKGDPASALLEVLDPEQNAHFRDHFLELPFDLSKVLFITTANTLETISRPLLDRMEVIEMTGYTDDEKVEIAKRHLIPKAIAQNGIDAAWVTISEEAIRRMITDYTRESGVRGLEKEINEVMRKVARRFVENSDAKPLHLTKGNLKRMLGEPKFRTDKIETTDRVGVVKGLAWTSVGGDTLDVEVALPQGKGELRLTGNLGDVMKESAQIALSYCRTYSDELQIEDGFFKTHDVHIHVPEGAVPKDGPSAGVTIATALASALTGAAVDHTVAMTGELTLRGKVLPIGGLKEKTLAAVRAGVKKVFLPDDNRSDYHELPASLRHAVEFRFVRDVSSIFREALHRAN